MKKSYPKLIVLFIFLLCLSQMQPKHPEVDLYTFHELARRVDGLSKRVYQLEKVLNDYHKRDDLTRSWPPGHRRH